MSHCIPPEVIITQLTLDLFPKLDSNLKNEVAHWAAFYEHRLQTGSKEIYHLEAFVAKFMSILLQYVSHFETTFLYMTIDSLLTSAPCKQAATGKIKFGGKTSVNCFRCFCFVFTHWMSRYYDIDEILAEEEVNRCKGIFIGLTKSLEVPSCTAERCTDHWSSCSG